MRSLHHAFGSWALSCLGAIAVLNCGGGGGGSTPPPLVQPPTALVYTSSSAVYTKGVTIAPNSPSSSGGTVVSYSVSPALPAGLSLNTTTGVLSGTPTTITATATYTVTATNAGGHATAGLSITVNEAAPAGLSYATNPAIYTKGTAIAPNGPSSSGGAVVSYSVSPALPAGLSLNTTTGVVSGTPTAITGAATYTVTATNAGGHATVGVSIRVNDVPPSISYGSGSYTFTTNVPITTLTPSNSGGAVVTWSISPSLPAGLNFASASGSISGTPSTVSAAAPYTVTATNSGGISAVVPIILVIPTAPFISTQPGNQATYRGQTATFSVTATGTGTLSYQWWKDGAAIPGATAASYTTPVTGLADSGSLFKAVVSDAYGSSATSATATLTVTPGVFTDTGPLGTPRWHHTATLMPNGKVLVVGGDNGVPHGVALASAELYDPATDLFTATGSLATARVNHTATLLPGGKVLIAGGYYTALAYLASTELYDPATGLFTATMDASLGTTTLLTGRDGHTATLLPSGKVLLAGGRGTAGYLASAELYDPATGLFTFTATTGVGLGTTTILGTARWTHTATLLPSGKILLAAGYNGFALASAELYDPATGAFAATGSLGMARWEYSSTLLPNGLVLLAGGNNGGALADAELYDPVTGGFTATGSMGLPRLAHTATLLPNGAVLLAGGGNAAGYPAGAELYDPATGLFVATNALVMAREFHTALLLGNKVLLAGGNGAAGILASAELYQ